MHHMLPDLMIVEIGRSRALGIIRSDSLGLHDYPGPRLYTDPELRCDLPKKSLTVCGKSELRFFLGGKCPTPRGDSRSWAHPSHLSLRPKSRSVGAAETRAPMPLFSSHRQRVFVPWGLTVRLDVEGVSERHREDMPKTALAQDHEQSPTGRRREGFPVWWH